MYYSSGAGKFKALVWLCSDEGPPPDGWLLAVSSQGGRRWRALLGLFYKGTNPIDEGSYLSKTSPLNIITLGIGTSTSEFCVFGLGAGTQTFRP